MKHICCFLDLRSPYAWLACARAPEVLQGLSYHLQYRLICPDAAAPAPVWSLRHAQWQALQWGLVLDMPARPLRQARALLHLALLHAEQGLINRFAAETVLRHVWQSGLDPQEPDRLRALRESLGERSQPAPSQSVAQSQTQAEQALLTNHQAARQAGVVGPVAWQVDGRVFMGLEALPMLRACMAGDPWFEGPAWDKAAG